MANIKSAKKRIRVIEKKTARNRRVKAHIKTALKEFETAFDAGEMKLAEEKLIAVEKQLDKAAAKGTIHKNAAARKISRLNKKFNKVNA